MFELPNLFQNAETEYRVLYDGMIFQRQSAGGINRYFQRLIGNLPEHVTPLLTTTEQRANNFPSNERLRLYQRQFSLPKPLRKIGRGIQSSQFRDVMRQLNPDLIHATYYDMLGSIDDTNDSTPLVITVHDMIHEKLPHLLDRRGRHAELKRRMIERADSIICVSHQTRNDLLELYPHCESISTVIYHATELGLVKTDGWAPDNHRPYFLYVGSRSQYKNFPFLLSAISELAAERPDIQLRVVGDPFSISDQQRIDAAGLSDHIVNETIVSDERLASLYRHAEALVYPSLYEGFGLPLLEAMSCDTPVLAANASCIPEVVQDAGVLFDPYCVGDLVNAMRELLDSPGLRTSLVARGRQRCSEFSWLDAAEQTVDVYQATLDRCRPQTRAVPTGQTQPVYRFDDFQPPVHEQDESLV